MLIEITKERFISSVCESKGKTLIVASQNYEERSLALPDFILDSICSQRIKPDSVVFRFIILQSHSQTVGILDELKQLNISKAREKFDVFDSQWQTIPYPDEYNQGIVSDLIRAWTQQLDGAIANMLVDVSGLPRSVIIDLSKAIDELQKGQKKRIKGIFVAYTTAKVYPSLRYPQDIGQIKAHFSKRPLQAMLSKKRFSQVEVAIFPGIQGFEAKLLYDELHEFAGSRHILVFVSGRDFMTSMIIMRANQLLLQEPKAEIEYFFSIPDGVDKLEKTIKGQLNKAKPRTLFLIAPFGSKPFAWVAYPLCRKIEGAGDYDAEIALLSGFQYTSVYSLGVGDTSVFEFQGASTNEKESSSM